MNEVNFVCRREDGLYVSSRTMQHVSRIVHMQLGITDYDTYSFCYRTTVVMGLTAKQLIYSIASVAVGGGLLLLLYKYIELTGAAYVAITVEEWKSSYFSDREIGL